MCIGIWKTQLKQLNSKNSMDLEKPWPELLALAFGYAGPSPIAWLGLSQLPAQSWARHIPTLIVQYAC